MKVLPFQKLACLQITLRTIESYKVMQNHMPTVGTLLDLHASNAPRNESRKVAEVCLVRINPSCLKELVMASVSIQNLSISCDEVS